MAACPVGENLRTELVAVGANPLLQFHPVEGYQPAKELPAGAAVNLPSRVPNLIGQRPRVGAPVQFLEYPVALAGVGRHIRHPKLLAGPGALAAFGHMS